MRAYVSVLSLLLSQYAAAAGCATVPSPVLVRAD